MGSPATCDRRVPAVVTGSPVEILERFDAFDQMKFRRDGSTIGTLTGDPALEIRVGNHVENCRTGPIFGWAGGVATGAAVGPEDLRGHLGQSGDDGVDWGIDQDSLGSDRVYVEAKRYADGNTVGAGAIRDFFSSLNLFKATKGLFFTTSAFTTLARETADRLGTRIVLIDSIQLAKLMIRHEVGCRIEETLHIKRVDEDFFE